MPSQAAPDAVLSHWSTLIENFNTSSLGFYQAVEAALARREVPKAEHSRVEYKEAGLLSAKREYLRIRREKLVFDICAAPFGTGFFISWWLVDDVPQLTLLMRILVALGMLLLWGLFVYVLGVIGGAFMFGLCVVGTFLLLNFLANDTAFDDSAIQSVPVLGALYVRLFKPATYFRIDSMTMFQRMVHSSVMEVLDAITTEKGLRSLSDDERKPVMREFYRKAA